MSVSFFSLCPLWSVAGQARADDTASATHRATAIDFEPFQDKVFIEARKSGVPVVLYFGADWCAPCQELHDKTFGAPVVVEAAIGIRFFRVDLTTPSGYLELVKKSFQVIGAPTLIVFGPDGKESERRFGYLPPDDFATMLGNGRRTSEPT